MLRASGKKIATLDRIDAEAREKDSTDRTAAVTAAKILRKNQITELYRTIFGREPDAAGLEYWVHQSPLEIDQIRENFIQVKASEQVTSPVVVSSITPTKNLQLVMRRQQIADLYRTVLGREPDEEGLNYWVNDSMSIEQIRENFTQVKSREQTITPIVVGPISPVSVYWKNDSLSTDQISDNFLN